MASTATPTAIVPSPSRLGGANVPSPSASPGPILQRRQTPLALGAYISGAPWDPTKIDQFSREVGVSPAIVMWYQNWVQQDIREFDPVKMNAVVSRGAMPLLSWSPCDGNNTVGGNPCSTALIAGIATNGVGVADAFLHQFAHDAKAWNQPFYLRLAWEMNGNWYPWTPAQNGNTAASYVQMWHHVHDIFTAEGATEVRWVWSPNTNKYLFGSASATFAAVYPGDAYVDWVALDGYNWGSDAPWPGWHSFTSEFATSYDELVQLTNKPIMIAETASAEQGGDKAAWIRNAFLNEIPSRFPQLGAVVWFDELKEKDWRIDSSATALAAFRDVTQSSLYQGRLP